MEERRLNLLCALTSDCLSLVAMCPWSRTHQVTALHVSDTRMLLRASILVTDGGIDLHPLVASPPIVRRFCYRNSNIICWRQQVRDQECLPSQEVLLRLQVVSMEGPVDHGWRLWEEQSGGAAAVHRKKCHMEAGQ